MDVTDGTLNQFAILLFKQSDIHDEETYTQTHMTLTPCQLRRLIVKKPDSLSHEETECEFHFANVQYQGDQKSVHLRLFNIDIDGNHRDVLNRIINQYRGNERVTDHTRDGLKYSVALIKKCNVASAPALCKKLTIVPKKKRCSYSELHSLSIYNDPSDMLYYGRYVSKTRDGADHSYYYAARTYNLHKEEYDAFQSAKIGSQELHSEFRFFLWTDNPEMGEALAEKEGISILQHYFSLAIGIMPEHSEESFPSNEAKILRIEEEMESLKQKSEEYRRSMSTPPAYLDLRLTACGMCIEMLKPPEVAEASQEPDAADFGGGKMRRKKRGRRTRNSHKSSRRVSEQTKRKKKRNRTNKRKVRSKTYKRTKRRTKRRTNKQSNRKTNKRSNRRYGNKNRLIGGGDYDYLIPFLEESKLQDEMTQRTKEEISKFFQSETGASDEEHRKAYDFIKQNYSFFLDDINSIIMKTDPELARNLKIEMSPTTRESREQPKPGFKKFRSKYAERLGKFRQEDPLSDEETGPVSPPPVSSSRGSIDVKSRWDKDDGMDDPARERPTLAKQLITLAQAFRIEMTEEEAMEYLRIYENNIDDVIVKLTEPETDNL